jgi:hypothetical protein
MAVSFELLRVILAIIGVGCAFMAGRALAAMRKGWGPSKKVNGWVIRGVVCVTAIVFRHSVDTLAMGAWILAAVAACGGYSMVLRQKPPEDLSHDIVPHDS